MLKRLLIITLFIGVHDASFASYEQAPGIKTIESKPKKRTLQQATTRIESDDEEDSQQQIYYPASKKTSNRKQPSNPAIKATQRKKAAAIQTNNNTIVAVAATTAAASSSDKKPSEYKYNPQKTRNLYNPTKQFKLSRSQLAYFQECPRCFYTNHKCGTRKPDGYPFTLNCAVDALLKKECDDCREKQIPHPICLENNLELVPFKHPDIERWRNSLSAGLQHQVAGTNITLQGGVDDVWIDLKTKILYIVDYKATSKKGEVNIDAPWQDGYKKQMEVYQYLLRKLGFTVSNTAYFVYCNGNADASGFNNLLQFKTSLISYEGNDSWVQGDVIKAYQCLQSATMPVSSEACNMCKFIARYQHHIDQNKSKVTTTATSSSK